MNPSPRNYSSRIIVLAPRTSTTPRLQLHPRWIAIAIALLVALAFAQLARAQATIHVNTTTQGVTYGNACSLQEAIYSAEFGNNIAIDSTDPDHNYTTACEPGTGNGDTIVLENKTYSFSVLWDGDAHNPFGPTATPIIFKTMTIQGNGAMLQWTGTGNVRLFAVGYASLTFTSQSGVVTSGTYSGTGNLTLEDAYVKGFHVKGGDGSQGGGGGLGAGGAIYVGKVGSDVPALTVINSTFQENSAIGGNGGSGGVDDVGFTGNGGGGGVGGNGGATGDIAGGGGGGSRGDGGLSSLANNFCSGQGQCQSGGGGGGTVFGGGNGTPDSSYNGSSTAIIGGAGGYLCGGNGGDRGDDGGAAKCAGGGGGGGGLDTSGLISHYGNGGGGSHGGGGGGGTGGGGSGGNGGFGGGGGSGYGGGGYGGFGGGGGSTLYGGGGGRGAFGGNGGSGGGGGGGALGGAIFNNSGNVVVQNSTFYNNSVAHGYGGSVSFSDGRPAGTGGDQGGDSGGAIFSRNGSLIVQNATISGNQATGAGGGIVVLNDGQTPVFVLDNTLIANNGAKECIVTGTVNTSSGGTSSAANLIVNNSGCPQVTVSSDPTSTLDSLKLNSPGDTPTMALLLGSPAIDAGDDNTALSTDQRGVSRPQGSQSDIGAFERAPQADLSLSKTVSAGTAKAGDTVTYTLTLSNLGPDTANSITVTDNFPSALTYASCSAPGGSCGTQGGSVIATYSTLAANSSATITITGALNSGYSRGTIITNSASAQATSPSDPDNTNNSGSASFKVIVPDFSLTAVSPITVPDGSANSSTITITSIDTFSSAVTLSSSGPTGFSQSFSPNPAAPPSNGSTSPTLTVNLGPSVTSGTYTVSVTGTAGSLTHSTSVTVSVQVTIGGTVNVINADQALGCIDNSGISGALKSKLNAVQMDIAAGKIQEAINTLMALLNQLQAQAGKHIKTSCTDSQGNVFNPDAVLIADVKALLASLGVNVSADPIMGNVVTGNGAGISGITVSILNSKNAIFATAITDVTGFYYFPATGGLVTGANFTVKVSVPKTYKNSSPSSQNFTWKVASVLLNNFVLN
jgi:uncharacterized repeat protein (TIGR01451 family)